MKQQVLNWSVRFSTCCYLDNQGYPSSDEGYECLVGTGERSSLKAASGYAFPQLKNFSDKQEDWLFGHFSYDLKSETENSPSHLPDPIQFPDLHFFVPETVILLHREKIEIGLFGNHHREILAAIENSPQPVPDPVSPSSSIQNRISKEEYIHILDRLHQHILRGDCYEINFCQEFFMEHAELNPVNLFRALNKVSPSPFSAYYTTDQKFLLCASPERYLQRKGKRILSQPMKGTAARDLENSVYDQALKEGLAGSEKDRAENVMVVDLVRNDLAKICETDSVRVEELFGVYSFAQVHQMISTIVGKPREDLHWTALIAGTFPMGSMTGAPKRRVLELIEQYEKTKRGLFSGALGYVKPNHDFDFNVVIRSMFYNSRDHCLSYFAGSGITVNSDPEKEYAECLLKVAAFERIIKNPSLF